MRSLSQGISFVVLKPRPLCGQIRFAQYFRQIRMWNNDDVSIILSQLATHLLLTLSFNSFFDSWDIKRRKFFAPSKWQSFWSSSSVSTWPTLSRQAAWILTPRPIRTVLPNLRIPETTTTTAWGPFEVFISNLILLNRSRRLDTDVLKLIVSLVLFGIIAVINSRTRL